MPLVNGGGGTFNGGTITAPLTIAQADGDVTPGLVVTSTDQPDAYVRTSIDGSGAGAATCLTLNADGLGQARLLLDDDTKDGRVVLATTTSYFQPRSDAADAAQTIECVDKSGNDKFLLLADGTVIFGRNAVPPDGDLAASQVCLWLDATVGATKLMVKAKDSGGSVVTASIALS